MLVKFLMTDELASYRDGLMTKSIGIYFIEGFIFLVCLTIMVNCLCEKIFTQSAPSFEPDPDTEYLRMELRPQQQDADKNTVLAGEK